MKKREKVLLKDELICASREVKEHKFSLGEVKCSCDELDNSIVDAGVTIDASWCSRGWSATDAVIAAISVDTGKVSSSCTECKKMQKKRDNKEMTRLEYLTWFTKHEPDCYINHEGSSAVS